MCFIVSSAPSCQPIGNLVVHDCGPVQLNSERIDRGGFRGVSVLQVLNTEINPNGT